MAFEIEVLFSPAEFRALAERDLNDTACVVFDVLRATSVMVTALTNGAVGLLPVSEISEALAYRRTHPSVLLAGERGGLRIGAVLADGMEFDLGNSPREFTAERVTGKFIVTTTTNGTRALRACAQAGQVLVCSFLNLSCTAGYVAKHRRGRLCLVCAGTGENAAWEDALAAGALCEKLTSMVAAVELQDSALVARAAFLQARDNLADAVRQARNARRLLSLPELQEDLDYCLRLDALDLVAGCDADKIVRRLG